jgi:hypothetical protein
MLRNCRKKLAPAVVTTAPTQRGRVGAADERKACLHEQKQAGPTPGCLMTAVGHETDFQLARAPRGGGRGCVQAAAVAQFKEAATWGRPPRLRSDLLFNGCAGVSLGAGRTQWARGSRRTCWPGRSGKATVFYHHGSLIFPRSNFDYASGGELRSNPTKPASRTALDLHCFAWADFNTYAVLARSSNPSDDH